MNSTASGAVYVQTNAAPNEVIAFRRADDGSLNRIGSVATGGDGDGSPHLTSQGSVALTRDGRHLLVTNAASDDLSVFSVAADGSIELRDRVHTGDTPRSATEHEGLVVVLNTGEPGLASFRLRSDGIEPVAGSKQALAASDADPAQVAFSPDGRFSFTTNFADGAVSRFAIAGDGSLSLEDATAGIAVEGMPGLRDENLSGDGRFLYAIDADGGRVYGWSVGAEGTLEPIGSW